MAGKTTTEHPLSGRKLYIPRMSTESASTMAAAFRSVGVDATVSPESDQQTLDLANRYTSGEECLPQRITLGNFLKVITAEDFDPSANAFILPTSSGPCRFGQYASLLQKILKEMGHSEALVFSPTSSDGYAGIGANVIAFKRTAWRALLVADILRKAGLMTRPYEANPGDTDSVQKKALHDVCEVLSDGSLKTGPQLKALVNSMQSACEKFNSVGLVEQRGSKLLIGMVGEIFLRFNTFGNQDIIGKIERMGGEVWLADIAEWIWYTNAEEARKLRDRGRGRGLSMLALRIKEHLQRCDEHALMKPFEQMFASRPEPKMKEVLGYSKGYLPQDMALGEMTINAGKTVDYYHKGCDGVMDINPFSCMNGIVTEVIYPKLSADLDGLPIRIFYFDGTPFDLEGDLEIFMEQVHEYSEKRIRKAT